LNSLVKFSTSYHFYPPYSTKYKPSKEYEHGGYKFSRYRQKILRYSQKKFPAQAPNQHFYYNFTTPSQLHPSASRASHTSHFSTGFLTELWTEQAVDAASCFAFYFVWSALWTSAGSIKGSLAENCSNIVQIRMRIILIWALISYFGGKVKAFIALYLRKFDIYLLTISVSPVIIAM